MLHFSSPMSPKRKIYQLWMTASKHDLNFYPEFDMKMRMRIIQRSSQEGFGFKKLLPPPPPPLDLPTMPVATILHVYNAGSTLVNIVLIPPPFNGNIVLQILRNTTFIHLFFNHYRNPARVCLCRARAFMFRVCVCLPEWRDCVVMCAWPSE